MSSNLGATWQLPWRAFDGQEADSLATIARRAHEIIMVVTEAIAAGSQLCESSHFDECCSIYVSAAESLLAVLPRGQRSELFKYYEAMP